eukprot:1698035-Prorocentrum_lima.AAC.1
MTSSLVGSEMCIRDRGGEHLWKSVKGEIPVELLTNKWDFQSTFLPSVGSVSYTHLTLPTICSV